MKLPALPIRYTIRDHCYYTHNMNKPSPIFPIFLATIIFALIVWSGINPHDRAVWYAEIIPVASVFFLLVATYRIFRFSNLAYLFMSFWLIMHSIGAYYTFADVPFESINRFVEPILGENRNHYDRIAHYIIGFYAYPMAEWRNGCYAASCATCRWPYFSPCSSL